MRLIAIPTAALLLLATFAALAPPASAVGWCSELTDEIRNDDCQHLLCWGRSTGSYNGYRYERCQLSEDDLPDPCRWCCICDPWTLP